MTKMLVVANQTIGGPDLEAVLRRRLDVEACTVHLVVPVVHDVGTTPVGGLKGGRVSPDRQVAEQRLDIGLDWLTGLGVETTGEVVTDDVADVVAHLVTARSIDEVIVSAMPSALSRFLRHDLPHRIARRVDVPVTTVTAGPAARPTV